MQKTYRQELILHYGSETTGMFRKLETTYIKLAKAQNHLTFTHRCKDLNILPNFVKIKKHHLSKFKQNILLKTEHKLLSASIKENHLNVNYLQSEIQSLELHIQNTMTEADYVKIKESVKLSYNATFKTTKCRQQTKIAKLLLKRNQNSNLNNRSDNIQKHKDSFVTNLSKRIITKDEENVLSKGLNFNMTKDKVPKLDIIASIESKTEFLPIDQQEFYRSKIVNSLCKNKKIRANLSINEFNALKTLKSDESIVIVPADKGRTTVIMDKSDYEEKMNSLLNGGQYLKIPKDPTTNIMNKIKSIIKKQTPYLSINTIKRLSPQYSKPPHIYGVPKIHKNEVPLRPIVSSINSPNYELSKFLLPILNPLFGYENSHIKNSYDFINILNETVIHKNDHIVSYDVISLFTNIPIDEMMTVIKTKLENDNMLANRTTLSPSSIMELLDVCVKNSYFQYNNSFFLQNSGLPMGGILSPLLSNIYMDHFENLLLSTWEEKPLLWLRYIDDIFCVWKSTYKDLDKFFQHLNSLRPTLKFTVEHEEDNIIPFLDVLIEKTDDKLKTSVYRKKTHTGQYLNFNSNTPHHVKLGIAQGLFIRAMKISSSEEILNQEIKHIFEELQKNDYPISVINKAYKKSKQKMLINNNDKEETIKPITTVVIPYVKGQSEKIRRINKKFNIQTSFVTNLKIRDLLSKFKPRNQNQETKNVVYKIPCECGLDYFGQTSRPLKVRLKEHKYSINNQLENYSKLTEHILSNGHKIQWSEASIVFKEENWKVRIIKEAACMSVKNCISQPSATLSPIYIPIVKSEVLSKIEHSKLLN